MVINKVPKLGTLFFMEGEKMARLNTSYRFSDKKKTTLPVVAIPTKVKDALCIDKVHKNGIFKIEPGNGKCMYDQCYIFEDINYKNQDEEKKNSTLLELMKFFKSLDYQVKLTIANEQQDMNKFVSEIFKPIHGDEYPIIKDGIGQWINQKIDEGTRDIRRVMYLTVTCKTQSFEEAAAYFATFDTTLRSIFSFLRSQLYKLSGEERLVVLQRILRLGEQGIVPKNLSPDDDSWKNQILPVSIISGEDCMQINSKYVSVLFAQDYDATLDEEKVVHSLTDTLFPTYITLDIEPIERRLLRDKLLAAHTNNETAISNENDQNVKYNQFGKGPSYSLGKKKNELETLMEQVDDNDEEGIFLGMLIIVPADSMEELLHRVETLKLIANTNGYSLEPYYHRQLKAFNTALPIGGRQVNHMRSLLTSSAVAFQPFYSKDLQDRNGQILGLNGTTKRLLRGNRKKLKNPHAVIIGYSGSGKSIDLKMTEVSQTLLCTDDTILGIDPNNELEDYCKSFRGQYFDLTPQCEIYLNPFEVPLEVWEADTIVQNRFLAKKSVYSGRFVAACMRNMTFTQLHLNFVERAIREMYEEYFGQKRYDKQPTLTILREKLITQQDIISLNDEKRILLEITNSLEAYTIGVYDMFAHLSNMDISNRFCVFGLKNIPENARKPIMLTLMHCIQMQVEFNHEELVASHLIVDETQLLCDDEFVSEELLHAIETYRKYGGIITLLFQNLTHAIENPKLRDMFSNCPCKIFFDQGGVDAEKLAQIQELSHDEFLALSNPKPGHGLLVWDKEVYLLDAEIDENNVLFPYIDTDFHSKAEKKAEVDRVESGEVTKERILHLLSINQMDEQTVLDMCSMMGKESEIKVYLNELLEQELIYKKDDIYYLKE